MIIITLLFLMFTHKLAIDVGRGQASELLNDVALGPVLRVHVVKTYGHLNVHADRDAWEYTYTCPYLYVYIYTCIRTYS